jgi:hypothetical protein
VLKSQLALNELEPNSIDIMCSMIVKIYINCLNQYELLSLTKHQGVNGITRATPICFLTIFVFAFGETFSNYSWNILEKVSEKVFKLNFFYSYYFIKVHVKKLAKDVIFKKIEIHL